MVLGVQLQGLNLAPALPNIMSTNLFQRCMRRTSLAAWSSGRREYGHPTSGFKDFRLYRGSDVAATAISTASVFSVEENSASLLKRRAQELITSPYDKEIWAVALPALVAMLLEPVMNAINAGLVGHLGTQQLSAMSLGGLAVSFCTFFYTFLLFLTVPEIAAAVVKKNDEEVSCIVVKSLWIAVVCSFSSAAAMFAGAEAIVGMLKPPEEAVAAFAIDFIKIRSLGIPSVLLGFVATAVFRGFKDTRTPLFAALVSAAFSLGLNVLFLYVLKLGVVGSAVATTVAQTVSCALLLGALMGSGKVMPRHLMGPPPLAAVLPTLKLGAVLGARNMISFGMVIYASALSIRLGSTHQAAFEVLRQMWLLAIQFFECLNVATQALCASYLGKEDRLTAKLLLNRLLALGVGVGSLAGAAVWLLHEPFIAFFTKDAAVVGHVMAALPVICLFFPIDAAAAIMDGSLLAAKQSNYMSAVQIAGSVVQYFVMAYLAATGNITSLTVWSALKILIVLRVVGGVVRNYYSPKSGYRHIETAPAPVAVAVAAVVAPAGVAAPPLPAAAVTPLADQQAASPPPEVAAAAAMNPPPMPSLAPESAEEFRPEMVLPAEVAAALTSASTSAAAAAQPEQAVALQSIEYDVMVLACAACTSATDMNPDLLSLKRRRAADGEGAASNGGDGSSGSDGDGGKDGAAMSLVPSAAAQLAQATVLQSIEDDVMVLACAACTSATDMNPDLLSLKRRRAADVSGGGEAGGDSFGDRGNVPGGAASPLPVTPSVGPVTSSCVNSISSAAG